MYCSLHVADSTEMLNPPTINSDGIMIWNSLRNAELYSVTITDSQSNITTIETTLNYINITNLDLICGDITGMLKANNSCGWESNIQFSDTRTCDNLYTTTTAEDPPGGPGGHQSKKISIIIEMDKLSYKITTCN